uniref:Alternative protein MYO19 n=1 Tax=Homo sapiens TaxID=9606 RepID=L8EB70_HUMAN|nr:alternative protein MYO19 [Homo sapiens]
MKPSPASRWMMPSTLSGRQPRCWGSQRTCCWRWCRLEPSGQADSSRCSGSPAPEPSVTPVETAWPN